MGYMVQGSDGQSYGPVDFATLKTWVAETRIQPTTMLRDEVTGQSMVAFSVPGLFAAASAPPVRAPVPMAPGAPASTYDYSQPPSPAQYPRAGMPIPGQPIKHDHSDVIWAILRSILAVVFFFVLHGIGLIFAIYAVVYGYRSYEKGHPQGKLALGISIVALVLVLIGWALRFQSGTAAQP